jgi:hypothetical protein
VVSDSKSLFRSILNIWGKPAENFAMLANRGQEIFVEASLEEVLESLVAHRLIDLGSEWHLHRHRYEHSAWEIYLAKTMRWHPKTSYIVVWTHS